MPRLSPVRLDARDAAVRATLGPFVCTWEDLPAVQRRRASTSTDARLMLVLVAFGGVLLCAVAPL